VSHSPALVPDLRVIQDSYMATDILKKAPKDTRYSQIVNPSRATPKMDAQATKGLIFSQVTNFSRVLRDISSSTLSISNRLVSIVSDASFVTTVAASYQRPLVANERCGSWYIEPSQKMGSCYFKSTDGHFGQWKFSSRRLNLHLLEIIEANKGAIIVDSTRRGKRMPDALSKTVPIWCAVINKVLFPDDDGATKLRTPDLSVSPSETAQIELRLEGFVDQFYELGRDIFELKDKLKKPLRPIWVTRDSTLPLKMPDFLDFHPVILCTSSKRVMGAEASEGNYIQGAGDDAEGWSKVSSDHLAFSPLLLAIIIRYSFCRCNF
jgi:tRNA A64-2'-O-ribosylphosphate transferase